MSAKQLLAAAHPEATGGLSDILAAARARQPRTFEFTMTIGDVSAAVVFTELRGEQWGDHSPGLPRTGNAQDYAMGGLVSLEGYPGNRGRNADWFIRDYPVEQIEIGGESPSPDEWHELVELFDAATRDDVYTALWWLHWGAPAEEERDVTHEGEAHD